VGKRGGRPCYSAAATRSLYGVYRAGASLVAVGGLIEYSKEGVRQMFLRHRLATRPNLGPPPDFVETVRRAILAGTSKSALCVTLKVTSYTLHLWLRGADLPKSWKKRVPRPGSPTPERVEEMHQEYLADPDTGLADLAARHGIPTMTLWRHFKMAGLQLRAVGRPQNPLKPRRHRKLY
jgi:hypothetical protein